MGGIRRMAGALWGVVRMGRAVGERELVRRLNRTMYTLSCNGRDCITPRTCLSQSICEFGPFHGQWRSISSTTSRLVGGGQTKETRVRRMAVAFERSITSHVKKGNLASAFATYQEMIALHVTPTLGVYTSLIEGNLREGHVSNAFDLFEEMKNSGFYANNRTFNLLRNGMFTAEERSQFISLLRREDEEEERSGRRGVTRLAKRSLEAYSYWIGRHIRSGDYDDAVQCMDEMERVGLCPTVKTFNVMMEAYVEEGRLLLAFEAFEKMTLRGIKADEESYILLRDAIHHRNDRNRYRRLVLDCAETEEASGQRLANGYNYWIMKTLINEDGDIADGLELYREMKEAGLKPSTMTYNTLIGACRSTGGGGEEGRDRALKLMKEMEDADIALSAETCALVMEVCLDSGGVAVALEVLGKCLGDGVTPNEEMLRVAMEAATAEGRSVRSGFSVMMEMEKAGAKLTVAAFATLIGACAREGDAERAFELVVEMEKRKLPLDEATLCNLRKGLSHVKHYERYLEIMETRAPNKNKYWWQTRPGSRDGRPSPPLALVGAASVVVRDGKTCNETLCALGTTYTKMMHWCVKDDDVERALALLEEMEAACVEPNVITYTVLIAGCRRERRLGAGRDVIEKMKAKGIKPTAFAYASLIAICRDRKDISTGIDLYLECVHAGVEATDPMLSSLKGCAVTADDRAKLNATLSGSASPQMKQREVVQHEEDAQLKRAIATALFEGNVDLAMKAVEHFRGQLQEIGAEQLNELIVACARYGDLGAAFELLSRCKDDDVILSHDTWIAVKASANAQSMEYVELYSSLAPKPNLVATTQPQRTVTIKGQVSAWRDNEHIQGSYRRMIASDVVPDVAMYGEVLDGLARMGLVREMLALWNDMNRRGVPADQTILSAVSRGCGNTADLELAQSVLSAWELIGTAPDQESSLALTNAAVKSRNLDGALEIHWRLSAIGAERSVVAFNNLMEMCVERCMQHDCDSCTDHLLKVYEGMKGENVRPNVATFNLLTRALLRDGETERAVDVLDEALAVGVRPIATLYHTMTRSLVENGDVTTAASVLEKMKNDRDCSPDKSMFLLVAKGHMVRGDISGVFQVLEDMKASRVPPEVSTFNHLIPCAVENENVSGAESLYKEMLTTYGCQPNVITFNALINGYVQVEGGMARAFELCEEMEARGLTPDIFTLRTIRKGVSTFRERQSYLQLRSRIVTDESTTMEQECLVDFNYWINGCVEKGDMRLAEHLLKDMRMKFGIQPDVVTFNTIMGGYALKKNARRVKELHHKMIEYGVKPDIITVNQILKTTSQLPPVEDVLHRLSEMGLTPDVSTMNTMLHSHLHARDIVQSLDVLDAMIERQIAPDAKTKKLMRMCRRIDPVYSESLRDLMRRMKFIR